MMRFRQVPWLLEQWKLVENSHCVSCKSSENFVECRAIPGCPRVQSYMAKVYSRLSLLPWNALRSHQSLCRYLPRQIENPRLAIYRHGGTHVGRIRNFY